MKKTLVEKAVILENITKKYGKVTALDNVSFDVGKGEFFVLMGPSPSGKSVLLKCIMGVEKPTSGKIYIDGQDMRNIPLYKRNVALMFQSYALFPHFTVFDNVAFGLKMRKYSIDKIKGEVEEVMRLVGLEGLGRRYPRELSGGQQQRVALARALVVKPSIFLFDEPLGNLDYKLQKRMVSELKVLHQKVGQTFFYATHSLEQAMALADRIVILNWGHVEQIGSPAELYANPNSVFVARCMGELNILNGRMISVTKDLVLIDTPVEKLQGILKAELKGKTVAYGVRPEKISIGEKAKECANRVEAKLISQIYKGSDMEYLTQLPNGTEFKVSKKGYSIIDLTPYIEKDVLLGWNPDDAIILDKASATQYVT